VHAGPHANHRVEVRRLLMQDELTLEQLLENGWNDGQQTQRPTAQVNISATGNAGAKRSEDRGFYGARVPYYRAVIGALQRIQSKQGLRVHDAPASAAGDNSRLAYLEI
jgi:hypothetical protein